MNLVRRIMWQLIENERERNEVTYYVIFSVQKIGRFIVNRGVTDKIIAYRPSLSLAPIYRSDSRFLPLIGDLSV